MQPQANLWTVGEGPRGGMQGGVGWGLRGAGARAGKGRFVQLLADLRKFDKGIAKLLLVSRVQTQAGLFHFPSLPEIILVVAIHKDGGTPLVGVQDLIGNLQSMRSIRCHCSNRSNRRYVCSKRKDHIAASHHVSLTMMKVKKTFPVKRQSLNKTRGDAD